MKFIYPAVFRKKENGGYHTTFPDLACCNADGDTLEETVDLANEAAYDWIYLELSEGGHLPPITDEKDIPLEEGDVIRNICVNVRLTDGWDE